MERDLNLFRNLVPGLLPPGFALDRIHRFLLFRRVLMEGNV